MLNQVQSLGQDPSYFVTTLRLCCDQPDCNFQSENLKDFEDHFAMHESSSTQELSQIIRECDTEQAETLKKYKLNLNANQKHDRCLARQK